MAAGPDHGRAELDEGDRAGELAVTVSVPLPLSLVVPSSTTNKTAAAVSTESGISSASATPVGDIVYGHRQPQHEDYGGDIYGDRRGSHRWPRYNDCRRATGVM